MKASVLSSASRESQLQSRLLAYFHDSMRADFTAGTTVALFALPQVMAYALLAGVEPKYGLYAFIVTAAVGAIFGSSRHLQTGPVNAVSVLVASSLAIYSTQANFMSMVLLLTLMVGVAQLAAGLLRLGKLTDFISRSVLEGFIGAGGLLIIVNQLPNLLGVPSKSSASILEGLVGLFGDLAHVRFDTLGLGLGTIALVIIVKRISPKTASGLPLIPSYLVAIMNATIVLVVLRLDTHGVRVVGEIPQSLPPFSLPLFDLNAMRELIPGTFAIGLVALAEAISIGRAVASMSGDRIDSDREFIGQGLANIAASFFSGMPVSGSLTRTQLLYRAGGVTKATNLLAAALVAVFVMVFAPLVRYIPVSALAGMLILIAINMVNWGHVQIALRATRADALAILATFFVALVSTLDTAIFVGVGISVIFFLRKVQTPHLSELVLDKSGTFVELANGNSQPTPEISIVQVEGNAFFGAADVIDREIQRISQRPELKVLIIRMKRAYHVDATLMIVLLRLHDVLKAQGKLLLISGVSSDVECVLRQSGAEQVIGKENIFLSTPAVFEATLQALDRAKEFVGAKQGKGAMQQTITAPA
jgi:sulfate permease, SulP family